MIKTRCLFVAICLNTLFSMAAFSAAPVVDDSENFAMLDDQEAAYQQPLAREHKSDYYRDEEPALANDSFDNSGNATKDNAALLDKVQGLKQEIQDLRGQLEIQAHELKELQEQQLSFYKDLDARIRNEPSVASKKPDLHASLEPEANPTPTANAVQSSKPTATVVSKASDSKMNPADEQISYLAAYELVKNKQYEQAINAMETFVQRFPQGGYSANAEYWLGELYMVQKEYPKAIAHFDTVLKQFPSSPKTAASMLKLGYAFAASGNIEDAKARLQQVIKSYPDTNTAQLAIAKLDSLE